MAGVRSDSGSRRGARPNIFCDHILWHHGDPARISDPRGGGLGGGRTPPATARSRPRANRDSVAGTRREAGDSLRLARSRRCRWPERSRSDLDRRLTGAVPRALPPFLRDARAKGRDGRPRLHSGRVRSDAGDVGGWLRPKTLSSHFSTLGAPNTSWDIRSRILPPTHALPEHLAGRSACSRVRPPRRRARARPGPRGDRGREASPAVT